MLSGKNTTPRVISGVIILTVSNIIVKILGLLCKIPLHNILQDRGMSYFNIAYNIFTTLYMISTAGLPIAISIMISRSRVQGKKREVRRIFLVALSLFFFLGIAGTLFMLFGSDFLASLMGSSLSYITIIAVSPTLFFICISSALRGYFQGHQNMLPTAISEITEAIGKFAIGISFGYYAVNMGYSVEVVAAYAITGITVGVALGMIFLVVCKFLSKQDYGYPEDCISNESNSKKAILKEMVSVSLPITIGAIALNMTGIIDTFTIINCMKGYIGEAAAETAYGNYSTLAVTLFHLPSAFIYPIASALTPSLSGAVSAGDKVGASNKISSAFKLMCILSVPSAFGMAILSKPILSMLFTDSASANTAAPLLSMLSLGLFFTSVLTLSTSILQSYKLEKLPVISMLSGTIVKLVFNILLISNSSIGIYGAAIGSVIGYFVMALINMIFVFRNINPELRIFRIYYKPLISSLIASGFTFMFNKLLFIKFNNDLNTVLSIVGTVIVYFLLLVIMKAFSKEDIILLPKGEKIYNFMKKLRLTS